MSIEWLCGWAWKMLPEEAERIAQAKAGGSVPQSQIIQQTDVDGNTRIYFVSRTDDPAA